MRLSRPLSRPLIGVVVAVGLATGPLAIDFAVAQDDIEDLRQQRENNRREAADVAAEIDELNAEDDELIGAIEALDAHIALQESRIAAVEAAIAAAEADAAAARAEADALAAGMDDIRERLQARAVDAFVAPRLDTLEKLNSGDLLEAEIKASYLGEVVGDEYDLIDQLRTAEAGRQAAERVAAEAADDAADQRLELADRLSELDASRAEAEGLRSEIAGRIGEWEGVAAEIEAADAAVAEEIRALEAELARQAAEARRQAEEEARRLAEENNTDPDDSAIDDPVPVGDFTVTHRPVPGGVTSGFGSRVHPIFGTTRNHYGLDFNGSTGQPIAAAASGTVLSAGWMNGYGNTVVISHGNGYTTLYAHQSELRVSSGETVTGGQTIGLVGSTGFSTGPHLHWEIRVDGTAVNPAPYL